MGELWEVKPKNKVGGERKLEFGLRMIQLLPNYSGKYSASWTTSTCGHSPWIMRQGTCFPLCEWHDADSHITGQELAKGRAGRACSTLAGRKQQPLFCPQFEVWSRAVEAFWLLTESPSAANTHACSLQSWAGRQLSEPNTKMLSSAARSWMLIPRPSWKGLQHKDRLDSLHLPQASPCGFFSREGNALLIQVLLICASSMRIGNKLN